MKTALLFLAFYLASFAGYSQGYTGLVGRWTFNGSSVDVSGNGLNGIVHGATLTTGYSGAANTAYHFDGVSNNIAVPYNSLMNAAHHSFCALVRPTAFYSGTCQGNYFISRGAENTTAFYGLEIFDNAWDNDCYVYSPDHEVFNGGTGVATSMGPVSDLLYTPYTSLNTWYCVVLTYDGDTTKIYVDGVLKSRIPLTTTYAASTDSLSFGKSQDGPPYDYYFTGDIDEIRVYNRALSAAEVTMFCDSAEMTPVGACDTLTLIDTLQICHGDTTTLNPSLHHPDSVTSVTWSPATGLSSTSVLTPILTGGTTSQMYYVSVSEHGCTLTDSVYVHILPSPAVSLGPDLSLCVGQTVTLSSPTTSGSVTYVWNTGSSASSISVNSGGSYWLLVTNTAGCSAADTVNVTYTTSPALVHLGNDTAICVGTSITLSPSIPAGYSPVWSTGSTASAITVGPGTYWISITNGYCVSHDTINIYSLPDPVVYLGPDTTLCSGYVLGSLISEPPGASYHWSTGSTASSITPTVSGTYWLQVSYMGCVASDTVHVSLVASAPVHLGNDTALGAGQSLTLSSPEPPGYHYAWSTGSAAPSITVSTSGTYWLIGYDSICSSVDTIVVTVNPIPLVSLGNDTSLCQGQSLTLHSSGAYTAPQYSWSTGANSAQISATTSGQYILTVTDLGCVGQDTINISFIPLPVVSLGTTAAVCNGVPLVLSSPQPAGAAYLWNTGSTASAITVAQSGVYSLQVTLNGCSASGSVTVTANTTPSVNLGPDTTVCNGFVMHITLPVQTANYLWSTEATGTSIDITSAGTYWATVSNECGTATDTLTVGYNFCDIWVPTAFTPNNDGYNDLFRPVGTLDGYSNYQIIITNRWGQVVFTDKDISKGWDGTFNGVPQEIGTYFYYITYSLNGQKGSMKGDFQLIR